jgi:hypothetical protein
MATATPTRRAIGDTDLAGLALVVRRLRGLVE